MLPFDRVGVVVVVVGLLSVLLLAELVESRAPAPAPESDLVFSSFPSPASPAPGGDELFLKRPSLSCAGVCGSYASKFRCFCDQNCEINGDCCDDYEAECACSCPVGEYRTDGSCLLVTRDTPDYDALCNDCTMPLNEGQFFSSSGGLTDSCTVANCRPCAVGTFRSRCGGNSMGTCDACPAPPEDQYYVVAPTPFNCSLRTCDAHNCGAGTYLDGCGAGDAGSCKTCPEPANTSSFYFTTGALDAAVGSNSSDHNATCDYELCIDAESRRCEIGQYLDACGARPLNLTNSSSGEVTLSFTEAACPGQLSAKGVCFLFQDTAATMSDAEAHCLSLGGHVAFSNDGAILEALAERAGSRTTWWIGALGRSDCEWNVLDTSLEQSIDPVRANWNDGEPNNCTSCDGSFAGVGECCVEVYGKQFLHGLWNDIDCNVTREYFCAVPTHSAGLCRACTTLENDPTTNSTFRYVSRGNLSDSCAYEFVPCVDSTIATDDPTTAATTTTTRPDSHSTTSATTQFPPEPEFHSNTTFVVDWSNKSTYETGIMAYLGDSVLFALNLQKMDPRLCYDRFPEYCDGWSQFCLDPQQAWVIEACPETCGQCAVDNVRLAKSKASFSRCNAADTVALAEGLPFVLHTRDLGVGTFYIMNTAASSGCPMPKFILKVRECPDEDIDGVCNRDDSCPTDFGNDLDGDGLCQFVDSCPLDVSNDIDNDWFCADVDSCSRDAENDVDLDGVCAEVDSCPFDSENDLDSDSLCGNEDPCSYDAANDQDADSLCAEVDSCKLDPENDVDADGVCGDIDSCPHDAENDSDSDTVCSDVDSCSHDAENDQDSDSFCSSVDSCDLDPMNDIDSDNACGDVDSCALDTNNDLDSDSLCGDIDSCPNDASNDFDVDGLCSNQDSCPADHENDSDSDRICGDVDSCSDDAENDVDSDAVCGDVDSCIYDAENDADGDRICGDADTCRYDAENDRDFDSLCGDLDSCSFDAENDVDSDGVCSDIDSCRFDVENDSDSDAICADADSCEHDGKNDIDGDALCSDVDSCSFDPENDADSDALCSNDDVCPYDRFNDADSDSLCDSSDSCAFDGLNDGDSDLVCDSVDSCRGDSENDADSDGFCAASDICPRDALNDADSDSVCDIMDSCLGDQFNDPDSDNTCGETACRNIRHYSELRHCDVVFGDVNLTIDLPDKQFEDAEADVVVTLPRLILGSVWLRFQCVVLDPSHCVQGSIIAQNSDIRGNLIASGALSTTSLEHVGVSGLAKFHSVTNVSIFAFKLDFVTAVSFRVANVNVSTLKLFRVSNVVTTDSGGIYIANMHFKHGGDLSILNVSAPTLTLDIAPVVGIASWPKLNSSEVSNITVSSRGGRVRVSLQQLHIVGSMRVTSLRRMLSVPTCLNAFDEKTDTESCHLHIVGGGLDCKKLFCPTCNYAHRCDLLCGFCQPEVATDFAGAATTIVSVARLSVAGSMAITDLEFHEAIGINIAEVNAGTVLVSQLLPAQSTVRAPQGNSSVILSRLIARELVRVSIADLKFEQILFEDLIAEGMCELDLRGVVVAQDAIVRNISAPA